MQPGKPTIIFNIAGNKVGLSVVPQTSATPNKTVMLQGMSPLLQTRKASPERTKKVIYWYTDYYARGVL